MTTGCYQCGSEEGTVARLCPTCITRGREKAAGRLQNVREEFATPKPEGGRAPVVLTPTRKIILIGLVLFMGWLFFFGVFSYTGPVKGKGLIAAALFSGMVVNFLVAGFGYLDLAFRTMLEQPILGIVSFVIPGMPYRYAFIHWEEYKFYLILNYACFALGLVLAGLLSLHIGVSVFEAISMLELYFMPKPDSGDTSWEYSE